MSNFANANKLYNLLQYENAIEEYRLCEDLPDDSKEKPLAFYNMGVCYIMLKQYTDAIASINKALLLNKQSKYYFNLGYCYSLLKLNEDALKYFKLALKLDPNDADTIKAIKLLKKYETKSNRIDVEDYECKLSMGERLGLLIAEINMALDINDRDMFMILSKEFNKLKGEY